MTERTARPNIYKTWRPQYDQNRVVLEVFIPSSGDTVTFSFASAQLLSEFGLELMTRGQYYQTADLKGEAS